ncbi:MAG: TcpQ domain-containing protein [Burkholderiales bacterium]|nr:TcpQ domain-containing protein [Burkholderiales bacterium]
MKQIIMIGVAAIALLPAVGSAADCKPVADYKVAYVSYKARPLANSLDHILRGTPYKGSVEGGTGASIKAKRLRGPLSVTLDKLAAQTGMQWQQEGCQVRFASKQNAWPVPVASASATPAISAVAVKAAEPAAKSTPAVWPLQADQPIHKQFAEWAHVAGWHFEWRLEKSWLVPAATQFTGTFDEALAKAVEALHAQGKPVRLILWEGNRFAEIVDVDAK